MKKRLYQDSSKFSCQDTTDLGGRENTICGSSKIANENRCQLIEVSEAKSPGKHDEKIQRREEWHFDGAFICTKVEALSEGFEKNLP